MIYFISIYLYNSSVLTTTPYDKRIYIGLNLLSSSTFSDMLMDILLNYLKVESILLLPNEVLPLYMSGFYSGLVIDCGFTDTRVMPVRII